MNLENQQDNSNDDLLDMDIVFSDINNGPAPILGGCCCCCCAMSNSTSDSEQD